MTNKPIIALIALSLFSTSISVDTAAAGGRGHSGDYAKVDRLLDGEDRGGPWVQGGISPYQTRHRVCNYLDKPAYDPRTGDYVIVKKKTCWFE